MNFGFLLRGLPGHPLHALTDATIGTYTFATVAALLDILDVTESAAARAWWVALLVGILFSPDRGNGSCRLGADRAGRRCGARRRRT